MLFSVKAETPVGSITRRIAVTDGRLSSAMDQLSQRLGSRDDPSTTDTTGEGSTFDWQYHAIDDTLRRLSENLLAAQDTLATLDGVDDVLGDIGVLVSGAMAPTLTIEERAELQQQVDILRPRFAALDQLDLSTIEGAVRAQATLDRAYEALFDFRRQVDGILTNLESSAENLRLAAAAWSSSLAPERAVSNTRVISQSIVAQPQTAMSVQARAETTSALALLKP